jgi:hypothetical protein
MLKKPPVFWKILGPSIILLGLGLGSGELILWPFLVSKYGLGIIWAAVIGITFQFFINMEIERYALLKGESIFAGFYRISKKLPYWFIFSTFVAWIWPGIIATSAKIFSYTFESDSFTFIGIILLILIGIILTLGPRLYKTVETFQKYLIMIGVPLIAIITFYISRSHDYIALGRGLVGIGEGYFFIPKGIELFTFLGALAYSGAGGNLNLAQSFYIKEKGYGMCEGSSGISSVLTGKAEKVDVFGKSLDFENKGNFPIFEMWWKLINYEHFIVFLLTGAITILLLALLSYATSQSFPTGEGVDFLFSESNAVKTLFAPVFQNVFLVMVAVMLFGTQLTVLDSTSRIISENIVILKNNLNLSKVYYIVLWLQILAGIIIFSFGYFDPITLVIIGAVLNALAMFFHIGATYILNKRQLPLEYQPSLLRKIILLIAWLFFGALSILAISRIF